MTSYIIVYNNKIIKINTCLIICFTIYIKHHNFSYVFISYTNMCACMRILYLLNKSNYFRL